MRIVLTGGATGGHVIPFEPIIEALREVYREQGGQLPRWIDRTRLTIYFLGVLDEGSESYLQHLGVTCVQISSGKLRRYWSGETPGDLLWRLPAGILKALWHMWRIMPDVVVSKGGFGSVPVAAAAIFYRVPFLLHESDAVMGLANRLMAKGAAAITVGYAEARRAVPRYRDKTLVTGTPVRSSFVPVDLAAARRELGLAPDRPVLLVMGGSQGAKQLNDVLLEALPSLLRDMSVIHLAGEKNMAEVKKQAALRLKNSADREHYKVFGYLAERMMSAMAAADLVVSRAGATALAELAHLKKATIIVPLDLAAQDHQRENAAVFERAEAARVIDPANLGRSLFEQNVRDILRESEVKAALENNIGLLDKPQAAREIALLSFKLARGLAPRQPKEPAAA